jgi:hypothetical protein
LFSFGHDSSPPCFGDVFLPEEMPEYFWHTKYQDVKVPVFSLFLRDSLS